LEDSGYMARAAYILDQVLGKFGLAGKSFIPLVVGAGCNLAGILSCRTLDDRKDRIVTALVNPFISCSERLPIYALFTAAFFPNNSGLVLFFIYFLGIAIALGSAKLFRTVFFQGKTTPLVIELPPYRIPTWRNLVVHAGERAAVFLRKMGGIILIGAIIIWALGYFPADSPPDGKLITGIGQTISPVMAPLGIDWKGSVALLSGFVAKENVVSTYSVIYGLEGGTAGNLGAKLAADGMTALRALSFMVFTLLYMPCLATLTALKRETGSIRWVLFSVAYGLAVAWSVSWLVYHIGNI
jgi:ferrous iron transport protein B